MFPTFENYVNQFRIFKNDVEDVLFYCDDDEVLTDLCQEDSSCRLESYSVPNHCVEDITYLIDGEENTDLKYSESIICRI